ncbi:MAG: Flp pilus assembly protein CpaB [Elusimicrobiaceae bacterium]|nr:Flp pilus assembly protein CpaB [Elusimicrobiaceae bacterium]
MEKKGLMMPLVVAFVAAMIYWLALSSKETALNKAYETANIIVARTDLPARTVITDDLVEAIPIPRRFVQQDAFEVRTPSDIKMVANLVTTVRIPRGNQLTQSTLMSLSPEAGLSVKVPPGERGAVLGVDAAIMGLVKPGDRIDIMVTFEAVMLDGRKEKVTATILQNILVLGVGGNLGQGMSERTAEAKKKAEKSAQAFSDKSVLSLSLSPIEAQFLALSEKQGDVSIVVRGMGDMEKHPMEMASFRKLFRQN